MDAQFLMNLLVDIRKQNVSDFSIPAQPRPIRRAILFLAVPDLWCMIETSTGYASEPGSKTCPNNNNANLLKEN
jgi:hypothetical protein